MRTKENVEKKQALTYEEMEAEREEVNYKQSATSYGKENTSHHKRDQALN